MSQHDYVLGNQSGSAFRADLNLALAALVSQNSGATEPATPYAYMIWLDTTAGLVKERNAANEAWVIIGDLGQPYWGMSTTAYVDAAAAALAAAYAAADAAHAAAANPHAVYVKHALATAANDFLVASGAGAFVKKTLAEVQTLLGIAGLTYEENYLAGDVPLTLPDTFYDGPSLSLSAGTWKLDGSIFVYNGAGAARNITVKLWDGTTAKSGGECRLDTTRRLDVYRGGIVVLASLTTWKISAAADGTGVEILTTPINNNAGCADTASYLSAVKIA